MIEFKRDFTNSLSVPWYMCVDIVALRPKKWREKCMKNRFSPWIRHGHPPKLIPICNTIHLDDSQGLFPDHRIFWHKMSNFAHIMIFGPSSVIIWRYSLLQSLFLCCIHWLHMLLVHKTHIWLLQVMTFSKRWPNIYPIFAVFYLDCQV